MLLQRYILRALLRNSLLVLVVLTGLIFLFLLGKSLGRQDWGLSIILSRLPFGLLVALGLSMPVSLLVGTLLTYGRLSADNEILAMRMGGIHPLHLILPAVLLGLLMSGISLYLNGSAIPTMTGRVFAISGDDMRLFLGILEEQRQQTFRSKRIQVSWGGVTEDGKLRDFFFELRPDGQQKVQGEAALAWVARDAAGDELTFYLEGVRALRGETEDMGSAQSMVLTYPASSLFDTEKVREKRSVLTNRGLLFLLKRDPLLGHPPESARLTTIRIEYWSRIWLAFACFACVFVGAPVGILLRRASFIGSGFVAVAIVIEYYPLLALAKSLAEHRFMHPALLLAVPNVLLVVQGLVLLGRLVRR